ncbi:Multimodular transpeptidase-transglycosylase [Candidatus Syntrophocurvum alkaliphilum]|uniref:Penicillin-binding protein 1A n=1 Tax=Candidatus Syntrophocurvum alkaliphilum TaxID=2293317 RepID=A0A6I6DFG9_9FIRM|nr:transglycosylase domain-containing protein [Candidatus Syntrophocurvum alkaliphilum]QGT99364.1 Multimodular transpeptidase-transglycosylase [Candidatus Syntrophocurvum alkaliphilum]
MRFIRKLVYLIIAMVIIIALVSYSFSSGVFFAIDWDNPEPLYLENIKIEKVGDSLVLGYTERNIKYVELHDIPQDLINAFIAIEDNRFFQHRGVDVKGVIRAIAVNIYFKELAQGGSTITQQLARNLFLGHDQTLERKIAEVSIAKQLEQRFSKEKILEMYLNQIYFGNGNWGISQAAKNYFYKNVEDLTLGESALLAGLVQAPSIYAPNKNWTSAINRQKIVLNRMVELEFITEKEAEEAILNY